MAGLQAKARRLPSLQFFPSNVVPLNIYRPSPLAPDSDPYIPNHNHIFRPPSQIHHTFTAKHSFSTTSPMNCLFTSTLVGSRSSFSTSYIINHITSRASQTKCKESPIQHHSFLSPLKSLINLYTTLPLLILSNSPSSPLL
jgi:hypothetical protein